MHRLLFLLFLVFSLPLTAQRLTPPKPVVIKFTATWCNVCGLYFWDDFKFLVEEFDRDAVIFAAHASPVSQLYTTTAEAIGNNFPDRLGQPELFLNGNYVEEGWINTTRDLIEESKTKTPVAYISLEHTMEADSVLATVNLQFLKSTNRPLYLALYIVEDQVTAFQNNRSPDDKHAKILRTHFGEHPFGTLIASSLVEQDATIEWQQRIALDTAWQAENLAVTAILWERAGDQYHILNANASGTPTLSTSVDKHPLQAIHLTITPTLFSQQTTVHLSTPSPLSFAHLELLDLNGRSIYSLHKGIINSGDTTFALTAPSSLSAGMYLLRLVSDGRSVVRKLILENH